MTRMTGPDCAVMCNLKNTHTHTSKGPTKYTLLCQGNFTNDKAEIIIRMHVCILICRGMTTIP